MSHYLKILFSALFVSFNVIIISQCCRRETRPPWLQLPVTQPVTMVQQDGDCRVTPSTFTTKIYEIGLCTAHPYGAAKTSATFDASTCVVIYTDAAPAAVDLAAAIGTNTTLPGTASAPPEGTYGFPYIKLGTDFYSSWLIYKHTSWRVSNYLLQQRSWEC